MHDHEIFHQREESTALTFSGEELKVKETSEFSGYGIRALSSGRLGFAYCQNENEVGKAIEKAKKVAHFSVKSTFSFAPEASFTRPDIFDPSMDPYDYSKLKDLLDSVRNCAESFGGRARVILSAGRFLNDLRNSEGFSGEYQSTELSAYVECMHGDGLGIGYLSSNKLADVSGLGLKAAGMAKDMQGAKKPKAGRYTFVMQPEALDSLIEILLASFSGDWKRRKISKISKGYQLSEKLNIYEDGLSQGTSARPFDDEGTPSEKRCLVKNGKVHSFLYDRETAALEGVEQSGACSRESYDSNPSIGAANIVVSPGDWNDLGEIEKYIELHYAHGSHTANLTTGDFGLEVSAAFMVEKEKRTPLKGFMITGNIFDLFSNIEAVESRQRIYAWLVSPRIAFGNLRVVA